MARVMTLQDLMQALGKTADEVNAPIRARQLPGRVVGDSLWRVDPIEWDAYLENLEDETVDDVPAEQGMPLFDLFAEEIRPPFDFPTESSTPPSRTFDDNARELSAALRAAFDAWVHRDATDPDEEIWIATELLLKGIFGFAAPTIAEVLDLNKRGARTVTQIFAQHLNDVVQLRGG
jgi:hypothetical protein